MKPALSLLLILIFINLSCYILNESGLYSGVAPEYNTSQIVSNLTLPTLIIAGGITVGGVIISLVFHTFVGPAILIVWAIGFLTNMGVWLFAGFPMMLEKMGTPAYITNTFYVIVAVAMFILVIEVTAQRDVT